MADFLGTICNEVEANATSMRPPGNEASVPAREESHNPGVEGAAYTGVTHQPDSVARRANHLQHNRELAEVVGETAAVIAADVIAADDSGARGQDVSTASASSRSRTHSVPITPAPTHRPAFTAVDGVEPSRARADSLRYEWPGHTIVSARDRTLRGPRSRHTSLAWEPSQVVERQSRPPLLTRAPRRSALELPHEESLSAVRPRRETLGTKRFRPSDGICSIDEQGGEARRVASPHRLIRRVSAAEEKKKQPPLTSGPHRSSLLGMHHVYTGETSGQAGLRLCQTSSWGGSARGDYAIPTEPPGQVYPLGRSSSVGDVARSAQGGNTSTFPPGAWPNSRTQVAAPVLASAANIPATRYSGRSTCYHTRTNDGSDWQPRHDSLKVQRLSVGHVECLTDRVGSLGVFSAGAFKTARSASEQDLDADARSWIMLDGRCFGVGQPASAPELYHDASTEAQQGHTVMERYVPTASGLRSTHSEGRMGCQRAGNAGDDDYRGDIRDGVCARGDATSAEGDATAAQSTRQRAPSLPPPPASTGVTSDDARKGDDPSSRQLHGDCCSSKTPGGVGTGRSVSMDVERPGDVRPSSASADPTCASHETDGTLRSCKGAPGYDAAVSAAACVRHGSECLGHEGLDAAEMASTAGKRDPDDDSSDGGAAHEDLSVWLHSTQDWWTS